MKNNTLQAAVKQSKYGHQSLVSYKTGESAWYGGAYWQTSELAMGHAKAYINGYPHLEQEYAQRFIDENRDGIVQQGVAEEQLVEGRDRMNENTTPTHSWGSITEVDGGFKGEPETVQETKTTLQNIEDAITALKDGWNPTALAILEEARDNEYVNQEIGPLSDSTDALRWATEFANKFTVWSNDGVEPDTKGLMIAWFANAIMAGVDNATRREQSRYVELHQWRRIDIPKQTGWFDDSKQRAFHTDDRLEGRTVYVKKVD